MEVIPAIDLLDGKCVRLYQGDYNQASVFSDNPVEVARQWTAEGATRLHVVDLDGAKEGKSVNLSVIEAIAKSINIPVQVGGGLRDSRGGYQITRYGRRKGNIRHCSGRKTRTRCPTLSRISPSNCGRY